KSEKAERSRGGSQRDDPDDHTALPVQLIHASRTKPFESSWEDGCIVVFLLYSTSAKIIWRTQSITLICESDLNAGPSLTAHFSPRTRTLILPLRHSQSTLPSRVESPFTLIVRSSHSFGIPAPMTSVGSLPDSSRQASISSWSSSISAAVQ